MKDQEWGCIFSVLGDYFGGFYEIGDAVDFVEFAT
jgi:hypothetical protein